MCACVRCAHRTHQPLGLLHAFVHTINLLSSLDNRRTRFIFRNYNVRRQLAIAMMPSSSSSSAASMSDNLSIAFLPIGNVCNSRPKCLCWHIVFHCLHCTLLPPSCPHLFCLLVVHAYNINVNGAIRHHRTYWLCQQFNLLRPL